MPVSLFPTPGLTGLNDGLIRDLSLKLLQSTIIGEYPAPVGCFLILTPCDRCGHPPSTPRSWHCLHYRGSTYHLSGFTSPFDSVKPYVINHRVSIFQGLHVPSPISFGAVSLRGTHTHHIRVLSLLLPAAIFSASNSPLSTAEVSSTGLLEDQTVFRLINDEIKETFLKMSRGLAIILLVVCVYQIPPPFFSPWNLSSNFLFTIHGTSLRDATPSPHFPPPLDTLHRDFICTTHQAKRSKV